MRLELGRVTSVGERVRQGSQFPIYTEIALDGGRYARAISKFPCIETRAPAQAAVTEWLGTCLAAEVGIQAPPCFLVSASDPVVAEMRRRHGMSVVCEYGFASQVCAISAILYPFTLQQMPPEDVARLYCYDMLFINADRTPENPNCGHGGGRLFAYDFGSSLLAPNTEERYFDRPFFGSNLSDRAEAHLCRDFVRSGELVGRTLDDMLNRIEACAWMRQIDTRRLPDRLGDHLGLLIRFLGYLVQDRQTIRRQIVSTI